MTDYDVIIIGGGCAGLSAALYAKRYTLKTLVIAKELGGLITTTHIVENYPGILPASGWDMIEPFLQQMKLYDVEIKEIEATKIERTVSDNGKPAFRVTAGGADYITKTIIFATGTKHKELGVPGEKEYYSRGVSYCATCDGALFKGKRLIVAGGGDSAAKEALLLSEYGSHVYVIARSKLRAEPINLHRIDQNPKVDIIEGNQITEILGDGKKVTHVKLLKEHNGNNMIEADGLFVEIGHLAVTDLAKPLGVTMNSKNEILIDRTSRTNVPGFFAAGDCTDTAWKQAIVSASEGSQAANSAYEYITKDYIENK